MSILLFWAFSLTIPPAVVPSQCMSRHLMTKLYLLHSKRKTILFGRKKEWVYVHNSMAALYSMFVLTFIMICAVSWCELFGHLQIKKAFFSERRMAWTVLIFNFRQLYSTFTNSTFGFSRTLLWYLICCNRLLDIDEFLFFLSLSQQIRVAIYHTLLFSSAFSQHFPSFRSNNDMTAQTLRMTYGHCHGW